MRYVERNGGLVVVVAIIWRCVPECHKISEQRFLLVLSHYIGEKGYL